MYYLEHSNGEQKRMRIALLLAAGLHLLLAVSVSFTSVSTPRANPQIEVTLAMQPSPVSPDEARHIAQSNQLGSGEPTREETVTSGDNAPPLHTPQPRQSPPRQSVPDSAARSELLSTEAASPRTVPEQPTRDEKRQNPTPGTNPEVDRLEQQLASLQAELDEQTRARADRPRVRRLSAVSARQAVDAAYLLDWRRRLEAVGNKYYPEASVRYGFYGEVRLLVVIRKDGSLEDIRILESSGYAVLDEATLKLVRMAAPYAPFPPELAATTDKLEIIRTWHFEQNALGSN